MYIKWLAIDEFVHMEAYMLKCANIWNHIVIIFYFFV